MKIGIISYPMLFQKNGGLQIQISETIRTLKELGVTCEYIDTINSNLSDYDIVHVFSSNHGNVNIVKIAKEKGCGIVISPLVESKWTRKIGLISNFLDRIVRKSTNYLNYTFYSQVKTMFESADYIIALGENEQKAISNSFLINKSKISIIPNGVSEDLFNADQDIFRETYQNIGEFILCVGTLSDRKNQLALAKVMQLLQGNYSLVLIGPVSKADSEYLKTITDYNNVYYLGELPYNSPLLNSAYAAARVFCLPSRLEILPLSCLEALAAGTPVITTRNSSMYFECSNNEFQLVDPTSQSELISALDRAISSNPDSESCRKIVADYTWTSVARRLIEIYKTII